MSEAERLLLWLSDGPGMRMNTRNLRWPALALVAERLEERGLLINRGGLYRLTAAGRRCLRAEWV